jgi:PTH1 family peptidyl-tRNA hydrolase
VPLRLVAALGNPGHQYRDTRHNVGFMVAREVLRRWRGGPERMEAGASVAAARVAGGTVLVVQPQTFMNRSGDAVDAAARKHGVEASEVLLIYDDADLPMGRIRIRPGGGAAGHRGVASIIGRLGTDQIMRIRMGIGRSEGDLADQVLSPFTREEMPAVEAMVEEAADAVAVIAADGIAAAMNRFNRRGDPEG